MFLLLNWGLYISQEKCKFLQIFFSSGGYFIKKKREIIFRINCSYFEIHKWKENFISRIFRIYIQKKKIQKRKEAWKWKTVNKINLLYFFFVWSFSTSLAIVSCFSQSRPTIIGLILILKSRARDLTNRITNDFFFEDEKRFRFNYCALVKLSLFNVNNEI